MTRRRLWAGCIASGGLALFVSGAEALQVAIQHRQDSVRAEQMTGGDASRAAAAVDRLGCGSCHDIPGIPGATGRVGPPLAHMAARDYIAGVMPNTAGNLVLWIRWPQGVLPNSAMPNMGASEREARDIAAYLLSLR
jgi:cytochrome c1